MFHFLIPSCIKNELHLNQLFRCVEFIRRHHLMNNIYIINDSDDEMDDIYTHLSYMYNNVIIIKSQYRSRGELLCLKYILDHGDDEQYVVMHDSMLLYEPLTNIESIKTIKFLWTFTNHMIDWDTILEERTEYNIKNNIITHTDLLNHIIKYDYSINKDFQEFAYDLLIHKYKWHGCMGLCYITNKKTITYMNDILPFIDIFLNKNTIRNRVCCESIFSIICYYIFKDEKFEESYDGLYYDGINLNKYAWVPVGYDNLVYVGKNRYIGKISFSR